jgi:epoxyqueuosine reductase
VDVEPALAGGDASPYADHVRRYESWLAGGRAGAMEYLVRGRDRRADPRIVFPAARSVFCVAMPYSAAPAGSNDPSGGPLYARYLRGRDYHLELKERLDRALAAADAEWRARGGAPLAWKTCVDTSAVLERAWASLAGLGWIGKNTMLIHPKLGSYLLLAEALLDQPTGRGPAPLKDYCGNCRRCLDSCPAGAFDGPRVLDSRRCISYLTLEKRGSLEPAERRAIGRWVAGCDVCQEACPFNTKPAREERPAPDGAVALNDWAGLLNETEEEYKVRVGGSALKRVKWDQFRRNLLAASENASS